jgi:hypothetical protein
MAVTEDEWLTCTDPEKLLEYLRGRASERKCRLFACACCRRIWHLLDGWGQNLVAVAERYVDGSVGSTAMAFAVDLHSDVIQSAKPYTSSHIAAGIVNTIVTGAAWALAWNVVSEARRAIRHSSPQADTYQESKGQADLLKDIFENPFHPVSLDLSWRTPKVVSLAQSIYDSRRFEDMPVLADALDTRF